MIENITPPTLSASAGEKINTLFSGFDFSEIVSEITDGSFSQDTGGLIKKIIMLFLGELHSSFALMGSLAAVVIVSALINNLCKSLDEKSVNAASLAACYIYISAIAATAFTSSTKYVYETITDITLITQSIIPVMGTLSISSGNISLVSMSHPVIFFICSAMTMLIKSIITPLVMLRAGCAMLFGLSKNSAMMEFSDLFSKAHRVLLTFSMMLFSGILTISRFAATSFDSLAARGVKFAVSTAVPVVGGSLAEAMNTVAGSALLLKNAVGIVGILMLFSVFTVPLIKLGALSVVYKIIAAVSSPIAQPGVISVLKIMGECIDMLFSSVCCMGVIMIIATASIL